jgi:hypothetical protein
MVQTQVYHTLLLATFLKKRLRKVQQDAVESELDFGRLSARVGGHEDFGDIPIVPMTEIQALCCDKILLNVAREIDSEFFGSVGGYFGDWDSQASDSVDTDV